MDTPGRRGQVDRRRGEAALLRFHAASPAYCVHPGDVRGWRGVAVVLVARPQPHTRVRRAQFRRRRLLPVSRAGRAFGRSRCDIPNWRKRSSPDSANRSRSLARRHDDTGLSHHPRRRERAEFAGHVLLVHGGPHGVRENLSFDYWVAFPASRGYAVLQPNYRGSGGLGLEWEWAGRRQWGGLMQTDVEDGVAVFGSRAYRGPGAGLHRRGFLWRICRFGRRDTDA